MRSCQGAPVVNTENNRKLTKNLPKTTKSTEINLKFSKKLLKNDLQNVRLYKLSVLSVCTVCNVDVLWPNDWKDQDATWHGGTEVGIGPGHIVLDGD